MPAPSAGFPGPPVDPVVVDVLQMLLADARLPVGAHTQSAGLEAALQAGMPPSDIPAYLRARQRTVVTVEAAAAVVARAALIPVAAQSVSDSELADRLCQVQSAWQARTVVAPLRENAAQLGRGLLRLAQALWPDARAVRAAASLHRPCRAVVLGAVAAAVALPAERLAALIGYDDTQTVAAAALKLVPMDPLVAAGWVASGAPAISSMVAAVADLKKPQDIPAPAAPQSEAWALRHGATQARLFRA